MYFSEVYMIAGLSALVCSQTLMLLLASQLYGVLRSMSFGFLIIDGQLRMLEVKELSVRTQ